MGTVSANGLTLMSLALKIFRLTLLLTRNQFLVFDDMKFLGCHGHEISNFQKFYRKRSLLSSTFSTRYISKVYLDQCKASIMELFCKNSLPLKAVNYLHKKLHQRRLTGLQMRLCILFSGFQQEIQKIKQKIRERYDQN